MQQSQRAGGFPTVAGRTAVVTGANCGIGRAAAERLAAHGANVVLTYLRMPADAHKGDPAFPAEYDEQRATDGHTVAEAIAAAGGSARAMEADWSDPAAIQGVFDFAEKQFGPVEILVLSASSWLADSFAPEVDDRFRRTLALVSPKSFDKQFSVDARGNATAIATFAERHIARGGSSGRIIAFTSGGADGFPQEVSYGAAKAALENYVKAAATELYTYGITANIIYPPVTDTGWVSDEVRNEADKAGVRIAEPRDVADAVLFLASDEARWVTGTVLRMK